MDLFQTMEKYSLQYQLPVSNFRVNVESSSPDAIKNVAADCGPYIRTLHIQPKSFFRHFGNRRNQNVAWRHPSKSSKRMFRFFLGFLVLFSIRFRIRAKIGERPILVIVHWKYKVLPYLVLFSKFGIWYSNECWRFKSELKLLASASLLFFTYGRVKMSYLPHRSLLSLRTPELPALDSKMLELVGSSQIQMPRVRRMTKSGDARVLANEI